MKKILLGLIGLLFAVPAVATDLPAGYTELEYIESTGTQYIDTGIKQQDGDEFGLVYQQITLDTSYRNLFGAAASGQASEFYISQTSSMTYVGNVSDNGIPHNTNKHTLSWVTTSSSSQKVVVDGRTYVVSVRITPNPNLNVMVFARNASNGKMIGKVYGYYQKRNGEYLINLVPAKNSSGVVGMYDTVSGRFFTNAGTGEFIASPEVSIRIATTAYNSARFSPVVTELNDTIATIRSVVTNTINQTKAIADLQATKQTRPDETCPAGKKCLLVEDNDGQPHWYEIIEKYSRLPDGFTELEYIEAQTNTTIRTDVTGFNNNNVEIYIKWMQTKNPTKNYHCIGQVYTSEEHNTYRLIGQLQSSPNAYYANGNTRAGSGGITYNLSQNTIHTTILSNHSVTMDGVTQSNPSPNATTIPASSTFSMMSEGVRLYSAYVKIGGDFKGDFVPAKRNSDGQLGIYNTITDSFLFDDTGTFVAGPEI